MKIECPVCHNALECESEWCGRKAQCPFCENCFVITETMLEPVASKSKSKWRCAWLGAAAVFCLAAGVGVGHFLFASGAEFESNRATAPKTVTADAETGKNPHQPPKQRKAPSMRPPKQRMKTAPNYPMRANKTPKIRRSARRRVITSTSIATVGVCRTTGVTTTSAARGYGANTAARHSRRRGSAPFRTPTRLRRLMRTPLLRTPFR